MSTPQDRDAQLQPPPVQIQADPLPPDVKVIEASCAKADNRAGDNSRWTNILNAPIKIQAGSELRVSQSFIDMRGTDEQIIQFENKGETQNNTHSVIFQLYTCNDGFNNKITSYDEMSQGNNALYIVDCGQGYNEGGGTNARPLRSMTGIGFDGQFQQKVNSFGIRPKNITIANGGKNYKNGDTITITGTGQNATGYVVVDDLGEIKHVFFDVPYCDSGAPTTATVSSTTGSGATINVVMTPGAALFDTGTNNGLVGGFGSATRGKDYVRNDILQSDTDSTGNITDGNQAQWRVLQISSEGRLNNYSFFDQGYNYQRAPVYRWAQTFEISSQDVQGAGLGTREYTDAGGLTFTTSESSKATNDPMLSAGHLIQNKEDEFVSGVFHNAGTAESFQLVKPTVCYTDDTSQNGQEFSINFGSQGIVLRSVAGLIEKNGATVPNTVAYNISHFPIGSAVEFKFELEDMASINETQLTNLSNEFINKFGGVFQVQNFDMLTGEMYFGNYKKAYQGTPNEYLWNIFLGATINVPPAPRPNETFSVPLVFVVDEALKGAVFTQAPSIEITTGADGKVVSFNLDDDEALRGLGVEVGMVFRIDPAVYETDDRFYVIQNDFGFGNMASAVRNQTLNNASLVLSTGEKVRFFIVPVPYYKQDNENPNSSYCGVQKSQGATFDYGGIYPATIDNAFLKNSGDMTPDANINNQVNNGLFRFNAETNYQEASFNPQAAIRMNHDTAGQMSISDSKTTEYLKNLTLSFGAAGGTDIVNPNTPGGDFLLKNGNNFQGLQELVFNKTNFLGAGHTLQDLPINCYLVIDENTATEQHCITGGFRFDGTNYRVLILARNIHKINHSCKFTSAAISTAMFPSGGGSIADDFIVNATEIINHTDPVITLKFVRDTKNINNLMVMGWGDGQTKYNTANTGTVATTSSENFFNINDQNYNYFTTQEPNILNLSQEVLQSYDSGGSYFLTYFRGDLATPDNSQNLKLNFTDNKFMNQGRAEWLFANLFSWNYSWLNQSFTTPVEQNNYSSFSDIWRIYEYEPFYRQKTFLIDKNFAIPSDIAGEWTLQSHALSGAINPLTGDSYVPSRKAGLLQNEFVVPVYGSNNPLNPNGTYRKLTDVYPDSGGLEPGHSVAINYLDDDADWISGELINALPEAEENRKFYYIFFRTRWTFIRGYDPLAFTNTADGDIPNRNGLITVNLEATKIGNANDAGSSTKKALDGSTMIEKVSPDTDPQPKAYELGTAGGVAPGGADVRFGNENQNYPVRYLDPAQYPKAKVSQYVGSDNMTLQYDENISTFTFQFFHQPFTAPFVDGQGGGVAARVFYGNRKNGIYNHEALGGVAIFNYARPEYPKGVFTFSEVEQNITNNVFDFGINPLTTASPIGLQFLEKIGFLAKDVGVVNGQIDLALKQVGIVNVPYRRNITLLMDDNTSLKEINSYNQEIYGTTESDLDSSDAILSETSAPEALAGLDTNNQTITPAVGVRNTYVQKWGSFIFYPYSLDTDNNNFDSDASNVRFDNASSTYGSIGGLLLSNSARGCGLPNTVGSTFLTDDKSIPRTLNPDCNLYLSYTVSVESSIKKASQLPRKLTNAYLVVLSSLVREPNFYMTSAGMVNAIATVSKTFVQGDFYLSQSDLSFYAKEDFYLSEITTEIKDTAFGSPSTLGINSSIIYTITNYNPKPEKQLPTIQQQQEIDEQLTMMIQQHYTANKAGEPSPLDRLYSDFQTLGLDLMTQSKVSGDIIAALKNQINYYDLPNLPKNQLTEFLRTPEGEQLISNAGDMIRVRQTANQLQDTIDSMEDPRASARTIRNLKKEQRELSRTLAEAGERIKTSVPSMFFRPAEPVENQIPPLLSLGDMNVRQTSSRQDFRDSITYRFKNFQKYRDERIMDGRRPVSFAEYQNFHYGNVLQPPAGSEGLFAPETTEFSPELLAHISPETLEKSKLDPFRAAYDVGLQQTALGSLPRSEPETQAEVDKFKEEVSQGIADLSKTQYEILKDNGLIPENYGAQLRGSARQRVVDSKLQSTGLADENKGIVSLRNDLQGVQFSSTEARNEAEERLAELDARTRKPRGRPRRGADARIQAARQEKKEYLKDVRREQGKYKEALVFPTDVQARDTVRQLREKTYEGVQTEFPRYNELSEFIRNFEEKGKGRIPNQAEVVRQYNLASRARGAMEETYTKYKAIAQARGTPIEIPERERGRVEGRLGVFDEDYLRNRKTHIPALYTDQPGASPKELSQQIEKATGSAEQAKEKRKQVRTERAQRREFEERVGERPQNIAGAQQLRELRVAQKKADSGLPNPFEAAAAPAPPSPKPLKKQKD